MIGSELSGVFPVTDKRGYSARPKSKKKGCFWAVKSPRPAPSIKREPALGTYLQITYLRRINFCSAWICLLIDAINATIDFRTSAFDTDPLASTTLSVPPTAA